MGVPSTSCSGGKHVRLKISRENLGESSGPVHKFPSSPKLQQVAPHATCSAAHLRRAESSIDVIFKRSVGQVSLGGRSRCACLDWYIRVSGRHAPHLVVWHRSAGPNPLLISFVKGFRGWLPFGGRVGCDFPDWYRYLLYAAQPASVD